MPRPKGNCDLRGRHCRRDGAWAAPGRDPQEPVGWTPYQYEQIAAYRSLIAIADAARERAHVAAFQQSVQEEEQAAQEGQP